MSQNNECLGLNFIQLLENIIFLEESKLRTKIQPANMGHHSKPLLVKAKAQIKFADAA